MSSSMMSSSMLSLSISSSGTFIRTDDCDPELHVTVLLLLPFSLRQVTVTMSPPVLLSLSQYRSRMEECSWSSWRMEDCSLSSWTVCTTWLSTSQVTFPPSPSQLQLSLARWMLLSVRERVRTLPDLQSHVLQSHLHRNVLEISKSKYWPSTSRDQRNSTSRGSGKLWRINIQFSFSNISATTGLCVDLQCNVLLYEVLRLTVYYQVTGVFLHAMQWVTQSQLVFDRNREIF